MGGLSNSKPVSDLLCRRNPSNQVAEKSSSRIAAKRLEIDENANRASTFENTLAGCEVMQWIIVQLSPKPQMNERRSNTMCAVIERPDHHCGDDLVYSQLCYFYATLLQIDIMRRSAMLRNLVMYLLKFDCCLLQVSILSSAQTWHPRWSSSVSLWHLRRIGCLCRSMYELLKFCYAAY